jgi:hypothetical protein
MNYNFKIIHIGKSLFWLSFLLGNIALFGYLIFKDSSFAIFGYFLLIFGSIVNLIAFFSLIIYGFFNSKHYDECLKSALILLYNIPIAILYAWIGLSII